MPLYMRALCRPVSVCTCWFCSAPASRGKAGGLLRETRWVPWQAQGCSPAQQLRHTKAHDSLDGILQLLCNPPLRISCERSVKTQSACVSILPNLSSLVQQWQVCVRRSELQRLCTEPTWYLHWNYCLPRNNTRPALLHVPLTCSTLAIKACQAEAPDLGYGGKHGCTNAKLLKPSKSS